MLKSARAKTKNMNACTQVLEIGEPCSNYKASVTEGRRNEVRLAKMCSSLQNATCADCKVCIDFGTAWASINLGVFVCIQCSGIHRSMGTHISKVRALAADNWNDDWIDNLEKWGNARAAGFWEYIAPADRPLGNAHASQTDVASRAVRDFVIAKYTQRLFAAPGEPTDWIAYVPLANGWARHFDPETNAFYYARGDKTAWEPPSEALPFKPPPTIWWPGHEGWLQKKSGGKEGNPKAKMFQKWEARFFVLPTSTAGTLLVYYKSDGG